MPGEAQAPEQSGTGAAPQQSFRERKAAQLASERAREPAREERNPPPARDVVDDQDDPDQGLSPGIESAVDNEAPPVEGFADEDEQGTPTDLIDDEAPEGEEDPDAPAVDWEKRFKDTQRELTRVNEERRERDQESAQIVESAVSLRHELEDTLENAKRYAAVYTNAFDQQIQQLETAFNAGQIDPEKIPEARQQYQALHQQRQALAQQVEQLQQMADEASQKERERKAEIARIRLSRTIPNWSRETWNRITQHAAELGFSQKEMAETTDARLIELIHRSMTLKQAGTTVEGVRSRQRQRAPNRSARQQPRSADGRFREAERRHREAPSRETFRAMKFAELQRGK